MTFLSRRVVVVATVISSRRLRSRGEEFGVVISRLLTNICACTVIALAAVDKTYEDVEKWKPQQ